MKFLVPTQASTVPSCQWLYIITFGGGLVEGDNVAVDIKVSENCTIVVTTQASTKVYPRVFPAALLADISGLENIFALFRGFRGMSSGKRLHQASSTSSSPVFKILDLNLTFRRYERGDYIKGFNKC